MNTLLGGSKEGGGIESGGDEDEDAEVGGGSITEVGGNVDEGSGEDR